MDLSPLQAQRVISALKRGVFPPVRVEYFTTGRKSEIASVKRDLALAGEGNSRAAFFEGDYGYGKSHMLRIVQSMALDAGFAVAWITIDGKTHAFNHPTRYLHGFLENLKVPGLQGRGLFNAVYEWIKGPSREEILEYAKTAPWQIRTALRHMATDDGPQEESGMSGWLLEGRDLQLKNGILHYDQFYERVESIGRLCRAAGLKGVVWLFDELECISKFLVNRQSRFAAYSVLKQLIDSNRFHHSCFFFATTSEFRDRLAIEFAPYDRYEGAAEFVSCWRAAKYPVHSLKKLNRKDNLELLRSVRDAHAIAYSWQAPERVSDLFVDKFFDTISQRTLTEREIIRSFVSVLEICEQSPTFDALRDALR